MGRRSLCTPERVARIIDALKAGAPIEIAASHGGIHRGTYHEWDAKGQAALQTYGDLNNVPEPDRKYADFHHSTTRARDEWELGRIASIQRAGNGRPYTKTIVTERQLLVDGQVVTVTDTRTETGIECDWRAEAWLMERRNPQRWGKVYRTELSGPDGAPLLLPSVDDLVARAEAAVDELADRRERRAAIPAASTVQALPANGQQDTGS